MHLVDIGFTMGKHALGSNFKQQRLSGNKPDKKNSVYVTVVKNYQFC